MMLSLKTFYALLRRDLVVFAPTFLDRLINVVVWVALNTVIFEYVFSSMNFTPGYGIFMACANIISNGFFEVMQNATVLVGDLEGNQSLSYDLTLPLPHWLVFSRIAISNTIQSTIISIFILPISKLLLWNQLNLGNVSWDWFVLIFICANLFYGFFSLYLASIIKDLNHSTNIWNRVIYPLWWLGGYQFSFATLSKTSPIFANFSLLNPMIYAFEGMRGAMLGTENFIHPLYCASALIGFTILVGYVGTIRMMRRLDCI